MSHFRSFLPVAVFLLGLAAVQPMFADDPPSVDPLVRIGDELEQLAGIVKPLQELLLEQVETQRIGLMLQRAEFAALQAETAESHSRRARSELRDLEREIESLQAQWSQLSKAVSPASPMPPPEQDDFLDALSARIERLRQMRRQVSSEVGEWESRLEARRAEVSEWKELVDEHLTSAQSRRP